MICSSFRRAITTLVTVAVIAYGTSGLVEENYEMTNCQTCKRRIEECRCESLPPTCVLCGRFMLPGQARVPYGDLHEVHDAHAPCVVRRVSSQRSTP